MLYTTDGNDSMKRIPHREPEPEPTAQKVPATTEGIAQPILRASSEVKDSRTAGRIIYLTWEQVDEWAKEVLMEEVLGFDYDDDNPCAEHWRNMKTELTAKMWGMFKETGLFLALSAWLCSCIGRYGAQWQTVSNFSGYHLHTLSLTFYLSSKYPLAIVSKMIDIFGADLGHGYDIGCCFKTTINKSLLGPKASTANHTCLVGAFHGHAHNCLCQLCFLATYVEGLGLEGLEGFEWFSSLSNTLACLT